MGRLQTAQDVNFPAEASIIWEQNGSDSKTVQSGPIPDPERQAGPRNRVPFIKYTSYGNNFVIVDECPQAVLTEIEKSCFAYQATNTCYGIGSDNFLVLQPCNRQVLSAIQHERSYWETPPDPNVADYIFRMFEPDGSEAFSCGNGLMCLANYLSRQHGVVDTRIMTEIPSPQPKAINIGISPSQSTTWANLGHSRRMSTEFFTPPPNQSQADIPLDDSIERIEDLRIAFRQHDLMPFSEATTMTVSGYLVFTGEPHLVVLADRDLSLAEMSKMLFIQSEADTENVPKVENRAEFGTWLIHHIGTTINRKYGHLFPAGMNVNFVRIDEASQVVEYRCFERGINRETSACGTGAVAVSHVIRSLNLLRTNPIRVWPHRCRWDDPTAQILVEAKSSGWRLNGNPTWLFDGAFRLHNASWKTAATRI